MLGFSDGEAATGLQYTAADKQIKFEWNGPAVAAPALSVQFNNNPEVTLTATTVEHTFDFESQEEGTCKVIVAGTGANAECKKEAEIPCKTSNG